MTDEMRPRTRWLGAQPIGGLFALGVRALISGFMTPIEDARRPGAHSGSSGVE